MQGGNRCGWPRLIAFVLVTAMTVCGRLSGAAVTSPPPSLWMMPPSAQNGRCFRELFTAPDAWKETRSLVTVLGYADWALHRQFTDDELRAWLPQIGKWGLKLGLEVGAVKEWGPTG